MDALKKTGAITDPQADIRALVQLAATVKELPSLRTAFFHKFARHMRKVGTNANAKLCGISHLSNSKSVICLPGSYKIVKILKVPPCDANAVGV